MKPAVLSEPVPLQSASHFSSFPDLGCVLSPFKDRDTRLVVFFILNTGPALCLLPTARKYTLMEGCTVVLAWFWVDLWS